MLLECFSPICCKINTQSECAIQHYTGHVWNNFTHNFKVFTNYPRVNFENTLYKLIQNLFDCRPMQLQLVILVGMGYDIQDGQYKVKMKTVFEAIKQNTRLISVKMNAVIHH